MGKLLNASPKLCTGRGARVPGDRQRQLLALQGTNSPAENTGAVRPSRRQPRHGFGPTCGLIPHPQVGPGPLSVHSDRSTLSYKTRTKALRSGNHGPRVRTPADRSRTSAGRTWASTSGSRTSRRPESSSQPRDPDPAPYLGRSPEPSQAPVGAAVDSRVWRRHVSHRADLRTSAPRLGRGSKPPRAPVGAAADPRVRCRHVSHRHESSA